MLCPDECKHKDVKCQDCDLLSKFEYLDTIKDRMCQDHMEIGQDCSTCSIYPCEPLPKTESEIMKRKWG